MTVINADSFEATTAETVSYRVIETGTVEVTLGHETRRVEAQRRTTFEGSNISIVASGFSGRYITDAKRWPTVVRMVIRSDGRQTETAHFRGDPDPKLNKMRALSFAA